MDEIRTRRGRSVKTRGRGQGVQGGDDSDHGSREIARTKNTSRLTKMCTMTYF